jgi:hypothetical protein
MDICAQLGLDSYRRVSGQVGFFHEEGHPHHRLTFYDAACVLYRDRFDARGQGPKACLRADVLFGQGVYAESHAALVGKGRPATVSGLSQAG